MRALAADIEAIDEVEVFGRVKTVQGLLIEVVGPVRELRVGGRVIIETAAGPAAQCRDHRLSRRTRALPAVRAGGGRAARLPCSVPGP